MPAGRHGYVSLFEAAGESHTICSNDKIATIPCSIFRPDFRAIKVIFDDLAPGLDGDAGLVLGCLHECIEKISSMNKIVWRSVKLLLITEWDVQKLSAIFPVKEAIAL